MKRITVITVLSLILSMIIGCNGGGEGSEQVKVTISPKDVTLFLGEEKTFTAVVSGASDQRVTWSATGGEINAQGCYQATDPGDFEVRATSKEDTTKKAVAKVHVLAFSLQDYTDITAWEGTVTWKVAGSWNTTDEAHETYCHQVNEDIRRDYHLAEQHFAGAFQRYEWWREKDSPVKITGTIEDKSWKQTRPGNYCEINWSGQVTVVPDKQDFLRIMLGEQTYSIYLYPINVPEIKSIIYEDGDPWESWEDGVPLIEIKDQPLTGMTLAGSKKELIYFHPLYHGPGAEDGKELEVTITWSFVPSS